MPLIYKNDLDMTVDKDYLAKMLKFHRKVNPKEGLLGLYFTSNSISKAATNLFIYYMELMKDKKNKPILP